MKLGTRGSLLALWQANTVARLLRECAGVACEIVTIRTRGDEISAVGGRQSAVASAVESAVESAVGTTVDPASLSTVDSRLPTADANVKALFVKEIEDALLDGRIDLAAHSAKDMSAAQPDGLTIGACLRREDPRDALILPATAAAANTLDAIRAALGDTPRIGTSSVRRAAQLTRLFPRASFEGVRGNVDTRLRKLDAGASDALVLAVAGLRRLGLASRISLALPIELCTPAPGQGVVAVPARRDRADVLAALAAINESNAADELAAEQALVRTLGGGCHLPVGALARIDGTDLVIRGIVIAPDGSRVVRDERRGPRADAVMTGEMLGKALLAAGADEILRLGPTSYGGPRPSVPADRVP